MNGRNSIVARRATSNADTSRMRIATSGSANAEICDPNWLTVSALQSLRKSGWRQSPPCGQGLRIVTARHRVERCRERDHPAVRAPARPEVGDEPFQPPHEAAHVRVGQADVDEPLRVDDAGCRE